MPGKTHVGPEGAMRAKMGRLTKGRSGNFDPIFAAEMESVIRGRQENFNAGFAVEWAERMTRPVLPAIKPSTLHKHSADCLEAVISVPNQDSVPMTVPAGDRWFHCLHTRAYVHDHGGAFLPHPIEAACHGNEQRERWQRQQELRAPINTHEDRG